MHIENTNWKFINDFLESIKKTFLTGEFGFTSYTSPNSMLEISNSLADIMLEMKPNELKVWLTCLSLLKRNHEPAVACTVTITNDTCSMGKSSFYSATSSLMKKELLIKTLKRSQYIINPTYANKLFKPKFDFDI